MTCTWDLCSAPAKFQVSIQFLPDLLDLIDDLLDDLNHKFNPLIREIKIQVYAKRQTWICTTWPSFPLIFRLLFTASTQK